MNNYESMEYLKKRRNTKKGVQNKNKLFVIKFKH